MGGSPYTSRREWGGLAWMESAQASGGAPRAETNSARDSAARSSRVVSKFLGFKESHVMVHQHLSLHKFIIAAFVVAGASLLAGCLHGTGGGRHHALGDASSPWVGAPQCGHAGGALQATAPDSKPAGDPYLLDVDVVSGAKLGAIDEQVIIDHEGRELRFASEKSVETFRADPDRYLAAVDAAVTKLQLARYALETCPVSGEKLGSRGMPVDVVFSNRLVRLCCDGCKADFVASPAKYVAKLDAAVIETQRNTYPTDKCVVTAERLCDMDDPIEYVLGERLVRLCCKGCVKKIRKDPLTYLAKLAPSKPSEPKGGTENGDEHKHGHRE